MSGSGNVVACATTRTKRVFHHRVMTRFTTPQKSGIVVLVYVMVLGLNPEMTLGGMAVVERRGQGVTITSRNTDRKGRARDIIQAFLARAAGDGIDGVLKCRCRRNRTRIRVEFNACEATSHLPLEVEEVSDEVQIVCNDAQMGDLCARAIGIGHGGGIGP